jgi:hypothetical protein
MGLIGHYLYFGLLQCCHDHNRFLLLLRKKLLLEIVNMCVACMLNSSKRKNDAFGIQITHILFGFFFWSSLGVL